jgi:GNAT superfamily N-acetyltransferase
MTESKEEILRRLDAGDISAAFQLSAQAGWNQTEEDWQTLLDFAPETCFGIEIGGELAATTTLMCYGQRLGWLGMVLTKLRFQRQGLARKLLRHTLNVADEMGIETLKLDATDQGHSLYAQCGFRTEHKIERWVRPGSKRSSFPINGQSSHPWAEQDLKCFGVNRLPLLELLAQRNMPLLDRGSYLFVRPGRMSSYLGPCGGDNPDEVRSLIAACLESIGGSWFWDLFPDNRKAVAIAKGLGFTPQRHLLRMARGHELTQNIDATYAIAGFELG